MKVYDVIKIFGLCVIDLLSKINGSIKKNVNEICVLLKCLYVAIMVLYCDDIKTAFILTLILLAVSYIVKTMYCKTNNITVRGLPVRPRRYTSVDRNGFIVSNEADRMEMLQYLFEIENYIEANKSD